MIASTGSKPRSFIFPHLLAHQYSPQNAPVSIAVTGEYGPLRRVVNDSSGRQRSCQPPWRTENSKCECPVENGNLYTLLIQSVSIPRAMRSSESCPTCPWMWRRFRNWWESLLMFLYQGMPVSDTSRSRVSTV